jgi:hypothetical protein
LIQFIKIKHDSLPQSTLNVMIPGVVVVWSWCGGGFFTDNNTTPTKVVLSCFVLLVGLWQ